MTNQDEFVVKQLIREALASFFGQTKISRTDESGLAADTIKLDDDIAEPVARLEQYGDVVVPPSGIDAIYWHNNAGGVQVPLSMERWRPSGDDSKTGTRGLYTDSGITLILHGSGSSKSGAVEVKTPSGATLIIDKDGNVKIDAAGGRNIVLNGGTADVARKGDAVVAAAGMVTWMSQVAGYINGLIAGTVSPAAPPSFGTVDGGNARIKG